MLLDEFADNEVLVGMLVEEEVVGVELLPVASAAALLTRCDSDAGDPKAVNVSLALLRGTSASLAVVYATGSAASNVKDESVQQSVIMRGAMTRSFGAQQ